MDVVGRREVVVVGVVDFMCQALAVMTERAGVGYLIDTHGLCEINQLRLVASSFKWSTSLFYLDE